MPGETLSPFVTSGIRIGTPAITTRGMRAKEMQKIADYIDKALSKEDDSSYLTSISKEVEELCSHFPCPV